MLRINEIKCSLDFTSEELAAKVAKILRLDPKHIQSVKIRRQAVDARRKADVHFTLSVDVAVSTDEAKLLKRLKSAKVQQAVKQPYRLPVVSYEPSRRPIIVGCGPAGLLAGVTLAAAGLRPIVLEQGEAVEQRRRTVAAFWQGGELNPHSNVQFGQGGAGAFSDGKLTTNTKDIRNLRVIEELIAAGAPAEIAYLAKPHIGTDILTEVVKKLGAKIETLGGELRFNSKLTELLLTADGGAVRGVAVQEVTSGRSYELETADVILAIGHSARSTFEMLHRLHIPLRQKPFSIGARIEHLQAELDRCQYGEFAGHPALGAADYKLSCHLPNGRSAYTFCMCPGGQVVGAASEPGGVVTNGMSLHARAAVNSNSALLVGITPADFGSDHPLAGMYLQRQIEAAAFRAAGESYAAPCQMVGDFLAGRASHSFGRVRPSFLPHVTPGDIRPLLPSYVVETMQLAIGEFARKLACFGDPEALLTAPETRSSSPVRIPRDESGQSLRGLYPCGEGAGYAGGIVSAAADGIRIAELILAK